MDSKLCRFEEQRHVHAIGWALTKFTTSHILRFLTYLDQPLVVFGCAFDVPTHPFYLLVNPGDQGELLFGA